LQSKFFSSISLRKRFRSEARRQVSRTLKMQVIQAENTKDLPPPIVMAFRDNAAPMSFKKEKKNKTS